MPHDAALPPGFPPPPTTVVELHGHLCASARWSGEALGALAKSLAESGGDSLRQVSDDRLLEVWRSTLSTFVDPGSVERRRLDPLLARCCGLSASGLQAGLEALMGGISGAACEELIRTAEATEHAEPVLAILASNLPALGVQPLLPALALRRPILLKSPSAEPLLMPALVRALGVREPLLAPGLAAAAWTGGDAALEAPLLSAVGPVLAYGGKETIDELTERVPERIVPYGPKASLAIVGADADSQGLAAGLARDVALFDQRGCLSIQAIYAAVPTRELADRLAAELLRLAAEWPPGPADPAAATEVHQSRAEADLRGLYRPPLELGAGTVIVEPLSEFRPSPGLRTVRIHPLEDLSRLPEILAGWEGRLQGAALAGEAAWSLQARLEELELSRFARPGELQAADALWHNGGLHPLAALQ